MPPASARPTPQPPQQPEGEARIKQELLATTSITHLQQLLPELLHGGCSPHLTATAWVQLAHLATAAPVAGGGGGGAAASAASGRSEEQQQQQQLQPLLLPELVSATAAYMSAMTFVNLSGLVWAWAKLGGAPDAALLVAAEEQLLRCKTRREASGAAGSLLGAGGLGGGGRSAGCCNMVAGCCTPAGWVAVPWLGAVKQGGRCHAVQTPLHPAACLGPRDHLTATLTASSMPGNTMQTTRWHAHDAPMLGLGRGVTNSNQTLNRRCNAGQVPRAGLHVARACWGCSQLGLSSPGLWVRLHQLALACCRRMTCHDLANTIGGLARSRQVRAASFPLHFFALRACLVHPLQGLCPAVACW